jgi:tRNA pseudouridine13 synthase
MRPGPLAIPAREGCESILKQETLPFGFIPAILRSMSDRLLETGYVTDTALRTGGEFKNVPEDFEVEEIPAYEPCGEGEHLYLWIEKRDVSAEALQGHLSRTLGCSRSDIGMAGLKDRRAVTRQWVSVPARCEPQIDAAAGDEVRIVKSARHRNKLRTGHLRGNRFTIRLRNLEPEAADAIPKLVQQIQERGVLNLYGEQRFGYEESTLRLGCELLRGEKKPRQIPHAKRRFLLRLALSSVQSALFNDVLAKRLDDGLLHTVLAGDVMQVAASGGPFVVEDVPTEQQRFDARETLITGPMFGPEMKRPAAIAAEREQDVLRAWNFEPSAFEQFASLTSGTRRAMLVWPLDLTAEFHERREDSETSESREAVLSFSLPPGAYATSVIREFTKQGGFGV